MKTIIAIAPRRSRSYLRLSAMMPTTTKSVRFSRPSVIMARLPMLNPTQSLIRTIEIRNRADVVTTHFSCKNRFIQYPSLSTAVLESLRISTPRCVRVYVSSDWIIKFSFNACCRTSSTSTGDTVILFIRTTNIDSK